MMDYSETFHPEPPLQVPAIFKKNQGQLSVSDRCLVFASPNGVFLEWKWVRLDKITATRAGFHKPMLKITHPKKGDLVFQFDNRHHLQLMKQECLFRASEAKLLEREALDKAMEDTEDERFTPTTDSMEGTEINVQLSSNAMELELVALRDEVYELKQMIPNGDIPGRHKMANNSRQTSKQSIDSSMNPLMAGYSKQSICSIVNPVMAGSSPGKRVDDNNLWHTPFGENSYTFLYFCSVRSLAFWYGVFVLSLQLATPILTVVDVADLDNKENPLQIPPMVKPTVTSGQAVALFFLLAYMSDLTEAMLKLQDGFYPGLLKDDPDATFPKWLFSCCAQLFTGLVLIVCGFVLIMNADTVLDVMLNMTALLFMTKIDDIGFAMAKIGFINHKLQHEAEAVMDIKLPKQNRKDICRRVLYTLVLCGLFTGYGILKVRQLDGYYLPRNVYVQYGDAYNPTIPFYSGILSFDQARTSDYRTYVDATGDIKLSYCGEENAWTFFKTDDPCDYFAVSEQTETYDVTDIATSRWRVKDSIDRLRPLSSFFLIRRDCGTCPGACGDRGLCECSHDQFGMDCEFLDVCGNLTVDTRSEPFPPVRLDSKTFAMSDTFHLLMDPTRQEYVRVYDMPVYYSDTTYPAKIIFYAGRRWIITSEYDLFDLAAAEAEAEAENSTKKFFLEKTVATLQDEFHGYRDATYTPLFISDPVDFETPDFQATPAALGWWTVKELNHTNREFAPDMLMATTLICQATATSCVGEPEGFCGEGICNSETELCECQSDYEGPRCETQKACYDQESFLCGGNGVCDESTGWCHCNEPYYGKLCKEIHRCYEEGGECKNGGTCNTETGVCECVNVDPAIHGEACEKRVDCRIGGCANGGICGWWNGKCSCREPFFGSLCELVNTSLTEYLCSTDADCGVNGTGTCDTSTGICSCQDPSRYGTLCEHKYNCDAHRGPWDRYCMGRGPCELEYCEDSCNKETGICTCLWGYEGPDCSIVPLCESDADCSHPGFGTGLCDTRSGKCVCPGGQDAGRFCEGALRCTSDKDCNDKGQCDLGSNTCQCDTGSTGVQCYSYLVGEYDPDLDRRQEAFTNDFVVGRCGFNYTCINTYYYAYGA